MAMLLVVFLVAHLAKPPSNNKTAVLLHPRDKIPKMKTGVHGAARWTQNSSPSAWTTTRVTCKSVGGIWSSL